MLNVQLEFAEYASGAFARLIAPQVAGGAKSLRFRPFNAFARQIVTILTAHFDALHLYADEIEGDAPLPQGVLPTPADAQADMTILCDDDPDRLSAMLLDYLDSDREFLLAPLTRYHYKARPLFLISIPKSGTHLLYEFAQTMGYATGRFCPAVPDPGTWYCIQHEHSHTRATDFLGETPWFAPFANRHHPFLRSPALFIYRNPLDILVSEANFYHRDGKTVYAGYYSGLSFEERLLRLVDDPWLMGSIRDRVGAFAAWLDVPNVIPVAFEEIVGPQGGGDALHQMRLIWSLQLKLHVPGTPAQFAEKVFNPNSPTFHAGQLGAYKTKLTPEAREKFLSLPQDFMKVYGYDGPDAENPVAIPKHVERFRKRPMTVSAVDYSNQPVMLEFGFMGHNLLLYRDRVYGLAWALGPFDITAASEYQLSLLPQDHDINELKRKVMQMALQPPTAANAVAVIARQLKQEDTGDVRGVA